MNLISKRIRGMQDVLPQDGEKWLSVINTLLNESKLYGFKFVRTPVLEHTNLFERSAGSGSDIVNKEMYSFKDKGDRNVSLRPEGTAGAMRLVLENGLHSGVLPLKIMYYSSCYRYEKPQLGRYREFFQFGLEIFGSSSYLADLQIISAANAILKKLGIKDIKLSINTIGCSKCREGYIKILKKYFESNKESLCKTCLERLAKNPLRILDCKDIECKDIIKDAPVIIEHVCEDCLNSFNKLKNSLDLLDISYFVNSGIVRGLDYYTGTVFEFLTKLDDTDVAICGGGRYDNLAKELGGTNLSAVGLGFGVERLLAIMEHQSISLEEAINPMLYIAAIGKEAEMIAGKLCEDLRKSGIFVESDISGKTLKSQMKYADKIKAEYIIVLGDEEIKAQKASIRNMQTKEEISISFDAISLIDFLNKVKN